MSDTDVRASRRVLAGIVLLPIGLLMAGSAGAYTLWSSKLSTFGTGKLLGPGTADETEFGDMILRNLMFVTNSGFRVAFSNNGANEPNICAEKQAPAGASGKLSNGDLLNENVDVCPMALAGRRVLLAVGAASGETNQPSAVMTDDGQLVLSVEASLDFGNGTVVKLPLYFTTASVSVPYPSTARGTGRVAGRAGRYQSGAQLTGRIGDENSDGWIDGTLVAAGLMPDDSPVAPNQPFVISRNFEIDMPVQGIRSGNIKGLRSVDGPGQNHVWALPPTR